MLFLPTAGSGRVTGRESYAGSELCLIKWAAYILHERTYSRGGINDAGLRLGMA